ncbi:hypothetical protein KIPB_013528 [Kipferlia bialata]|uniref:Barstar (barnase inhibitor) domain-containing protein n=1 Tax=Kipferlia bialata TaxID=797122 RepID=A0A9K3DAJ4_9EUKA|nr:hypothetical protein KIPB_013528 [Kipferlia bialata]|eukprot:g13528.t1
MASGRYLDSTFRSAWGRNLDALSDILSGGFGFPVPFRLTVTSSEIPAKRCAKWEIVKEIFTETEEEGCEIVYE